MGSSSFLPALFGGALLGAAGVLLMWTHGRVLGISGIYGGALGRAPDRSFRLAFIAGLVASGMVAHWLLPTAPLGRSPTPLAIVAVAGLLVGFGTRLANGCTSGHGICGVSRVSVRSLVATGVFMALGMLTACMVHAVLGVRS